MAENGLSKKEREALLRNEPTDRRAVTHVPFRTMAFLDFVSEITKTPKHMLYRHIWRRGLVDVFGITEEELDECSLTVPKASEVVGLSNDFHKLTDEICGG
jgi:hypothetical protein